MIWYKTNKILWEISSVQVPEKLAGLYFELVSVPLSNFEDFSKSPRQKLKINVYSNRARLTLQEYIFTFNFYRGVFEKSVFKESKV